MSGERSLWNTRRTFVSNANHQLHNVEATCRMSLTVFLMCGAFCFLPSITEFLFRDVILYNEPPSSFSISIFSGWFWITVILNVDLSNLFVSCGIRRSEEKNPPVLLWPWDTVRFFYWQNGWRWSLSCFFWIKHQKMRNTSLLNCFFFFLTFPWKIIFLICDNKNVNGFNLKQMDFFLQWTCKFCSGKSLEIFVSQIIALSFI